MDVVGDDALEGAIPLLGFDRDDEAECMANLAEEEGRMVYVYRCRSGAISEESRFSDLVLGAGSSGRNRRPSPSLQHVALVMAACIG